VNHWKISGKSSPFLAFLLNLRYVWFKNRNLFLSLRRFYLVKVPVPSFNPSMYFLNESGSLSSIIGEFEAEGLAYFLLLWLRLRQTLTEAASSLISSCVMMNF
jgi:hypothetical protein